MDNIISEIVEIINNNQSLIGIEMAIETYFTEVLSQLFSKALERIDLELILGIKKKALRLIELRSEPFNLVLDLLY